MMKFIQKIKAPACYSKEVPSNERGSFRASTLAPSKFVNSVKKIDTKHLTDFDMEKEINTRISATNSMATKE